VPSYYRVGELERALAVMEANPFATMLSIDALLLQNYKLSPKINGSEDEKEKEEEGGKGIQSALSVSQVPLIAEVDEKVYLHLHPPLLLPYFSPLLISCG